MTIEGLIEDVSKICLSYLTKEELIYIKEEWSNFGCNRVCNTAAVKGWLDLLIWARQNGCEWNSMTCAYAAKEGHLAILKWARENGCDWDSRTCAYAAQKGHLEVLKWARQNGCKCEGIHHEE